MHEPTISEAIGRALTACTGLASLGEEVEDEWQYVTDLAAAWRARLEAVATERGAEPVGPETEAALDAAIEEVGLIVDPHRAIDWLSTFPQVVLAAFGTGR